MIKFNVPYFSAEALQNIEKLMDPDDGAMKTFSGDGKYTERCRNWFQSYYDRPTLLTHSCTAALEMSAHLCQIKPGDEVIMPSYTFVSTANAFALQGAIPVFIDVRADNFNIDEKLIEEAITAKTKAIVAVHYAGIACAMDEIMAIAKRHNLVVIEDAAQAFDAFYKGADGEKRLGTIGDLGCLSFHETKNISSGEGGLLIINNHHMAERAEMIREKGTNRSLFFRGQVDKYTWVDIGSSYLPSDIIAAYLYSQLPVYKKIQNKRLSIWHRYYEAFSQLNCPTIKLPTINDFASNNAHMFYLVFDNLDIRSDFVAHMKSHNIITPFHYVPLHSSPAGKKLARYNGDMTQTDLVSNCLVRLPLHYHLPETDIDYIIQKAIDFIERLAVS